MFCILVAEFSRRAFDALERRHLQEESSTTLGTRAPHRLLLHVKNSATWENKKRCGQTITASNHYKRWNGAARYHKDLAPLLHWLQIGLQLIHAVIWCIQEHNLQRAGRLDPAQTTVCSSRHQPKIMDTMHKYPSSAFDIGHSWRWRRMASQFWKLAADKAVEKWRKFHQSFPESENGEQDYFHRANCGKREANGVCLGVKSWLPIRQQRWVELPNNEETNHNWRRWLVLFEVSRSLVYWNDLVERGRSNGAFHFNRWRKVDHVGRVNI